MGRKCKGLDQPIINQFPKELRGASHDEASL